MKKKKFISAAALLLMLLVLMAACSKKQAVDPDYDAREEYKDVPFLISAEELNEKLGEENLIIVDLQKQDAYLAGHIPSAINKDFWIFSDKEGVPGDEGWGTQVDLESLKERMMALGMNDETTVVFYSNVFKGPGPDGRAVWQLRRAGYENAKLLMGGITRWQNLKYDLEKDANEPIPSDKEPSLNTEYEDTHSTCTLDIEKSLGKEKLIDVRSEGEFKGSQNAGEPRGGHIKGAENLEWLDFLNSDGTPKKKSEIVAMMADLGIKPEDDFTFY